MPSAGRLVQGSKFKVQCSRHQDTFSFLLLPFYFLILCPPYNVIPNSRSKRDEESYDKTVNLVTPILQLLKISIKGYLGKACYPKFATSGISLFFLPLLQKEPKKSRLIFFFYGFNHKIFIRRSLRTLRSLAAPSPPMPIPIAIGIGIGIAKIFWKPGRKIK